MSNIAAIATREMVADSLEGFSDENISWLELLMDNPSVDEIFIEGLYLYLDRQAGARFINAVKLQRCGQWLGSTAPARLQIRLMEAARSSQHAAYRSVRDGLVQSCGLERAYPKAEI